MEATSSILWFVLLLTSIVFQISLEDAKFYVNVGLEVLIGGTILPDNNSVYWLNTSSLSSEV